MSQPVDIMAEAFEDELKKIAAAKEQAGKSLGRRVAPIAAGIAGYEALRRAEKDRRMGRAVRIQQGQQGY